MSVKSGHVQDALMVHITFRTTGHIVSQYCKSEQND